MFHYLQIQINNTVSLIKDIQQNHFESIEMIFIVIRKERIGPRFHTWYCWTLVHEFVARPGCSEPTVHVSNSAPCSAKQRTAYMRAPDAWYIVSDPAAITHR